MRPAPLICLLGSLASVGCMSNNDATSYGVATGGASAMNGAGTSGAAGNPSAGAAGGTSDCIEPVKPLAQRVVRLTYGQLENSLKAVLGPSALDGASVEDPRRREFQALFTEGDLVNTQVLQKSFALGEAATSSVPGRYESLTGCADAVDEICANEFLLRFGEQVYRRPLLAEEKASIAQLYSETKAVRGNVKESVQSAALGILTSPAALYRTELGVKGDEPTIATLTGYEVASSLSYFLLNGPPDTALLDAAKTGRLTTAPDIAQEVDRLLALDAVKQNLTAVLIAYSGLKDLDGTAKDPQVFPDFSVGVRNSMYTETQLFVANALWQGKVNDLMTSRKTFLNDTLAKFYGVDVPGASGGDFAPFEFPAGQRAGLLTQGSVMTTRARTDTTSVVSRGLFISGTILCSQAPPPPPAAVQAQVDQQLQDKDATERDKAKYRDTTAPCNGCHLSFDGYGLVLENYDGIGRLRTRYPNGSPIDTAGELPMSAGGGAVADVTGLVEKVAQNGTFSRCLTSNLLKYALADVSLVDVRDCNVKRAHDAFLSGDGSFADLIKKISSANLLAIRTIESTP